MISRTPLLTRGKMSLRGEAYIYIITMRVVRWSTDLGPDQLKSVTCHYSYLSYMQVCGKILWFMAVV
jgi:hypothetical protein